MLSQCEWAILLCVAAFVSIAAHICWQRIASTGEGE